MFSCVKTLLLISLLFNALEAEVNEFAKKGNEFAFDLYAKAVESEDKNIILSPFSVQTCAALVHAGAAGITAEEIARGARLDLNRATVGHSFKNILDQYIGNNDLRIANKIYIKEGYELKPEFSEIATNNFHSEVQSINFDQNKDAAENINSWVERQTNNKIKNIISPGDLVTGTSLILVNAIYFSGRWEKKFPKSLTREDDFWVSETESIKVDMMRLRGKFMYGSLDDLNSKALELPYAKSNLSMLIILPNERNEISKLESALQKTDLAAISSKLFYTYDDFVHLKLPKIKIESQVELSNLFEKMGMISMFQSADFSNLLKSREPLKISGIVHKTFIDVQEEGTEAGAATVIRVQATSGSPSEIIPFYVNKPFLYFIKDTSHNIFFMGRFTGR